MDGSSDNSAPKIPVGLDAASEAVYTNQAKLLKEFIEIATIDKAWTFRSPSGMKRTWISKNELMFF